MTDRNFAKEQLLRDAVVGLLVLAIAGLSFAVYYTERYRIISESMDPTLSVGEVMWAVRIFDEPQRGEIVVFKSPTDSTGEEVLVKRVVGLPGEHIQAVDGEVLVNNAVLYQDIWLQDMPTTEDFEPFTLGAEEYFLMGDNRSASTDSRVFGPVHRTMITYRLTNNQSG